MVVSTERTIDDVDDVKKLLHAFENGTDKVRKYLTNDCSIVYECRMCRELHRNVASFTRHKTHQCKDTFDVSVMIELRKQTLAMDDPLNTAVDTDPLQLPEQVVLEETTEREFKQRNLEAIRENLTAALECRDKSMRLVMANDVGDVDATTVLETIPNTNVAYYQTSVLPSTEVDETMATMVDEMHCFNQRTTNVKVTDEESPTGERESPSVERESPPVVSPVQPSKRSYLKPYFNCQLCNAQYTTVNSLKIHINIRHDDNRFVYPCRDCSATFINPWGVYRHLIKCHHRDVRYVKRHRRSIIGAGCLYKARPVKAMKVPKSIAVAGVAPVQKTAEEKINEEWVQCLELDSSIQRCGGCGRRYERKAALVSHTNTCSKRIAMNNAFKKGKKKEADKKPTKPTDPPIDVPKKPEDIPAPEVTTTKRKRGRPRLKRNDQPETLDEQTTGRSDPAVDDVSNDGSNKNDGSDDGCHLEPINDQELSHVNGDGLKSTIGCEDVKRDSNGTLGRALESSSGDVCVVNDQKTGGVVKADLLTNRKYIRDPFGMKILAYITYKSRRYTCKCGLNYTSLPLLRAHMARHFNYVRFACSVCDFRAFTRALIRSHLNQCHGTTDDGRYFVFTWAESKRLMTPFRDERIIVAGDVDDDGSSTGETRDADVKEAVEIISDDSECPETNEKLIPPANTIDEISLIEDADCHAPIPRVTEQPNESPGVVRVKTILTPNEIVDNVAKTPARNAPPNEIVDNVAKTPARNAPPTDATYNYDEFEMKILTYITRDHDRYVCKCGMIYANIRLMRQHMSRHLSYYRYACSVCDNSVFERDQIARHLTDVHGIVDIDGKYHAMTPDESERLSTAFVDIYDDDVVVVEDARDSREVNVTFAASLRDVDTSVNNALNPHRTILEEEFLMDRFGQIILPYVTFEEKRLMCKCGLRFRSVAFLRRHMARHFNYYRYVCRVCNVKTFRRASMRGHLDKRHATVVADLADKYTAYAESESLQLMTAFEPYLNQSNEVIDLDADEVTATRDADERPVNDGVLNSPDLVGDSSSDRSLSDIDHILGNCDAGNFYKTPVAQTTVATIVLDSSGDQDTTETFDKSETILTVNAHDKPTATPTSRTPSPSGDTLIITMQDGDDNTLREIVMDKNDLAAFKVTRPVANEKNDSVVMDDADDRSLYKIVLFTDACDDEDVQGWESNTTPVDDAATHESSHSDASMPSTSSSSTPTDKLTIEPRTRPVRKRIKIFNDDFVYDMATIEMSQFNTKISSDKSHTKHISSPNRNKRGRQSSDATLKRLKPTPPKTIAKKTRTSAPDTFTITKKTELISIIRNETRNREQTDHGTLRAPSKRARKRSSLRF